MASGEAGGESRIKIHCCLIPRELALLGDECLSPLSLLVRVVPLPLLSSPPPLILPHPSTVHSFDLSHLFYCYFCSTSTSVHTSSVYHTTMTSLVRRGSEYAVKRLANDQPELTASPWLVALFAVTAVTLLLAFWAVS